LSLTCSCSSASSVRANARRSDVFEMAPR
jgi:hypothetical protein